MAIGKTLIGNNGYIITFIASISCVFIFNFAKASTILYKNDTCLVFDGPNDPNDPNDDYIRRYNTLSSGPDDVVVQKEISIQCFSENSDDNKIRNSIGFLILKLVNEKKSYSIAFSDNSLIQKASDFCAERPCQVSDILSDQIKSAFIFADGKNINAEQSAPLGGLVIAKNKEEFHAFAQLVLNSQKIAYKSKIGEYSFNKNDMVNAINFANDKEKNQYEDNSY